MASRNRKGKTRITVVYAAVTLAVLAVLFALMLYSQSQIAEVYELELKDFTAQTAAEAQAACRADNGKLSVLAEKYPDCLWVWCGDNVLHIVRTKPLVLEGIDPDSGFMKVSFKGEHGKDYTGYIIDPIKAPNVIAKLELEEAGEYTFDSVSMSVRTALREGSFDFDYDDAVWLWEKGGSVVYAVHGDAVTVIDDGIASFTDDGGTARVCYVLDTAL